MAIESAHEQLLTVPEVAARLRVHPITVRRLIKAGRLPAVRIGRSVRVREADVVAFLCPGPPSLEPDRRWPPTSEEIARRTKLMKAMLARRDARPPLGFSTLELVRESRRELEERDERRR